MKSKREWRDLYIILGLVVENKKNEVVGGLLSVSVDSNKWQ